MLVEEAPYQCAVLLVFAAVTHVFNMTVVKRSAACDCWPLDASQQCIF